MQKAACIYALELYGRRDLLFAHRLTRHKCLTSPQESRFGILTPFFSAQKKLVPVFFKKNRIVGIQWSLVITRNAFGELSGKSALERSVRAVSSFKIRSAVRKHTLSSS